MSSSQACLLPECSRPARSGRWWCGAHADQLRFESHSQINSARSTVAFDAAVERAVAELRRRTSLADLAAQEAAVVYSRQSTERGN